MPLQPRVQKQQATNGKEKLSANSTTKAAPQKSKLPPALARWRSRLPVIAEAEEQPVSVALPPAIPIGTKKRPVMPGTFPFDEAAKGNKLGAALKEAADSRAALRAGNHMKRTSATKNKRRAVGDGDWEMMEGASVENEYVLVLLV